MNKASMRVMVGVTEKELYCLIKRGVIEDKKQYTDEEVKVLRERRLKDPLAFKRLCIPANHWRLKTREFNPIKFPKF